MSKNRSEQLPHWFNLEHYNCLYKELTPNNLYWELVARKRLINAYQKAPELFEDSPLIDIWLLITSNKLAASGLDFFEINVGENKRCSVEVGSMHLDIELSLKLPHSSSIKPLSVVSLIDLTRRLELEINDGERITQNDQILYMNDGKFLLADVNSLQICESEEFFLQFDLQATDQDLLQQLKDLLPKLRHQEKNKEKRASFVRGDERKITSQHLLPYLDLTFWSQYCQVPLTAKNIADALFPHWVDRDEKFVRDTLKPFSKKCLSEHFLQKWKFLIDSKSL
jgi:hypothetical protein